MVPFKEENWNIDICRILGGGYNRLVALIREESISQMSLPLAGLLLLIQKIS
jgi:hypothetical protein